MNEKENSFSPRLLVVMDGDINNDPEMRVKYNSFVRALGRKFHIAGIYNAKLRGLKRLLNALSVWHPNLKKWKERATKNVPAFIARSRNAAYWVWSKKGQADVVIQLGTMFDSGTHLPKIIYTDYTAQLSARHRKGGRSPLKGKTLHLWLGLEAFVMKQSAMVCTRSQLVSKSIMEDYELPSEQICVIGGGVNLERLPEIETLPENMNPTILFIGLDYYRKGGDLVLRAFESALTSVPNARLLFVTKNAIPEGMPLTGVKVISPIWNRRNFLRLYMQADIFVLPSRLETWGDVLLEAMAYGLPCIGVTGQSMTEIIRDGETGLLVPPENVNALADAFIKLLEDGELRNRMGQAGRQRVENEFTWDHVVERLSPRIVESANRRHES